MSGEPLKEKENIKYRSDVGALQYLTLTRPYIYFPINKDIVMIEIQLATLQYSLVLISWSARKLATVSRSSIKAEYKYLANAIAEIIGIIAK